MGIEGEKWKKRENEKTYLSLQEWKYRITDSESTDMNTMVRNIVNKFEPEYLKN